MGHMRHRDRPEASTDHTVLTNAYRDDRSLAVRQRLYDYQRPRFDLPGLVLEHAGDRAGVWADVGCGNGYHLSRIRAQRPDVDVVGLDLSEPLLSDLVGAAVCADAARLPLKAGSAQAVLMMHMLYHVTEPGQALAEAARVLAPDGVLLASTNSRSDKAELDQWWAQAAAQVLDIPSGPKRVKLSDHFPSEAAASAVGAHFGDVRVINLDGVIEVDTPDPVLKHYASYRAWADQVGVPFQAVLERVDRLLRTRLEDGPVRITTRQALIVGQFPVEHGAQGVEHGG